MAIKTTTKTTPATKQSQEIISKYADDLAIQFGQFGKKTVENLIQMSRVVFEAKMQHSKDIFKEFCRLTGVNHQSSSCRKYIAIGEHSERLLECVDRLPNSWTTLYTICTLPDDQFDQLLQSKVLSSSMTAKDMKLALGSAGSNSPASENIISLPLKISANISYAEFEMIMKGVEKMMTKGVICDDKEMIQRAIKKYEKEHPTELLAA